MTGYARAERTALAELMSELGPDAPTLCGDWTTADLAAHLVVRDRRPDSGPGLLLPALAPWTESVRRSALKQDYATLVAQVAQPPWWSPVSNPVVHEAANLMEFFIHHEDVRRAQPEWQPRTLPAGEERVLWRRLGALRFMLRRIPATVLLTADAYGELRAGKGGTDTVRVTGTPGELVLFCSGRQQVAQVKLEGPDPAADQLRTADLGL